MDFVLVHGGFHGGWCYARVASILRSHGHRVYTPTLTGLGERCHLARVGVTFEMHVEDVLNVIRFERLQSLVLCGHSYGGSIISAVADRDASRIAALVYLDASIPENGRSTLDLLSGSEQSALRNRVQQVDGQPMLPPFPASAFEVNAKDASMVEALLTSHPFATLCDRVSLTGRFLDVRRKVYIRATGWAGTHPETSYQKVKGDPDWTTLEIPHGHDLMLDAPQEVADALLNATR